MSTEVLADRRLTTNRLISCGLIAGPLFVVAFLIEGAVKGVADLFVA